MRCPLEEESFYREYSQWAIPAQDDLDWSSQSHHRYKKNDSQRWLSIIAHHWASGGSEGAGRLRFRASGAGNSFSHLTILVIGIIGFTSIIIVNTLCSVQTVLKCTFFWLHPWVWFGSISSLFVEKKHPNDVSNFQAKLFSSSTLTCVCLSEPLVANHFPHGT